MLKNQTIDQEGLSGQWSNTNETQFEDFKLKISGL